MTENPAATCKVLIIHEDRVRAAQENMPDEERLRRIGDFFKILGDPTRVKIIHALMTSEMCVCDLTAVLGMNQPAVSQHLKNLKQAGFVTYRREGKVVYYALRNSGIRRIFKKVLATVQEEGVLA